MVEYVIGAHWKNSNKGIRNIVEGKDCDPHEADVWFYWRKGPNQWIGLIYWYVFFLWWSHGGCVGFNCLFLWY